MGKRKEKIRPLKAWQFLVGWVLVHAIWSLGSMTSTGLLTGLGSYVFEGQTVLLLMTPIYMLLAALLTTVQFRLLRRFLQKTPRFWVQAHVALTLLGSIATAMILWTIPFSSLDSALALNFMNLLQYGILVALEWLILRRCVRFAWLWIPAVVGTTLFRNVLWQLMGAVFMTPTASFGLNLASTVGSNLILGLAIMLMVFLSRRSNNTLQDSDINEDDESDYARLADADSDPQVYEAPLVQRRAQSY